MFGNKKKEQRRLERGEEFLGELRKAQKDFEAERKEAESSGSQMKRDLDQIAEHDRQTSEAVQQNLEAAASAIYHLNACGELLLQKEQTYQELCTQVQEQNAAILRLVDENKHFTSPSKYLTDLPAELRKQSQGYLAELTEMENSGKQMGVLALNAAIEAGRMGDSGQQFVSAAEDIRLLSGEYEASVQKLRSEIEASAAGIEKLEEQIRHLVNLLKDNNIATTKLMKRCSALEAGLDKKLLSPAADAVEQLHAELIGIKNANEEILKEQERSRMLIEDVLGEFDVQQKTLTEMEDSVMPMFVITEDFLKSGGGIE